MSNIPPLPPGFVLEDDPQQQNAVPPLPPGFEMMPDMPQPMQAVNPMRPDRPVASAEPSDDYKMARAGYLGALDGASLSFGDELGAGLGAASEYVGSFITGKPGRSYTELRDQMRAQDKAAQAEAPGSYLGGQIAGGISSAAATVAAAPAAGARALGIVGTTVPERLAASGISGLGIGTVQGVGAGEGSFEDHLWSAAKSGISGGVGGVAAYPLAAVAGKGVNAVVDILASRGGPISRGAQNILDTTLANEGLTLEEANRLAQQHGPAAMLADATEGLRYRTEQLAQADTPSRSAVINTLRDRSAGAKERITGAFDDTLGPRPNLKTELDRMTGEQKTKADALYGQARKENAPVDVSPVLAAIDDQMLTPAERIAGKADLPDDAVDAQLRWVRSHLSNGDVQRTGIDKLDKLERRIRARARVEFKTGHSDTGSALASVGRVLRDQMKASSPVYKTARETFADDAAVQDAFETGQNLFAKKTHPDFLAAEVADMSEAERNALKLGTRAAVDQAMGSVRNGSLKGRQLLDSDFNERKILAVLGEEDGRALINRLQGEGAMADTANQVLGGPATARRMDNPFRTDAPTIDRVPSGAIHAGLTLAQKGVDLAAAGGRDRLARELGPVLTATGRDREAIVQALMDQTGRRGQSRALDPDRQALIEAVLKGGSLAYAPNARR